MASPNVYIHDTMQEMLDAFDDLGFAGVALKIPQLDQDYSPYLRVSRLATPVVVEHSTLLLSQLSPDIIRSILANTLVEDVTSRTVVLNDWNRIPRSRKEEDEPGIYANYFTKGNGTGLTVNEYEEWVNVMCAILRKQPYKGETHKDMVTRVNNWFNSNTTGAKVVDLVEEVHNSAYTRYGKTGAAINPTIDLNIFEKSQKDIVASARRQNASEIRFFGEVGWAINVDDRCKTHGKLQGSAVMFRLAICVVGAYFSNYNFKMTSYCLFRVVSWIHAEIGESVGSHLVNSYAKYGGFNYTTAGLSIKSSWLTDVTFWKTMCNQYEDVIKFSETQIQRDVEDLLEGHQEEEDDLALTRAYKKLEIEGAELDDKLDELEAEHELNTVHRRTERKYEALRETIESQHREATKCQAQLNALATSLGYKPITSTQATPYIERAPASSALQSTQATPATTLRR
ncbi:hypothetical protein KCU78_g3130, partial [Aureobasidium melanogenum]